MSKYPAPPWNKEVDDVTLKSLFNEGLTIKAIASRMNRGRSGIETHLARLKLSRRKMKLWTPKEDQIILQIGETLTVEQAHKLLPERGVDSLRYRAKAIRQLLASGKAIRYANTSRKSLQAIFKEPKKYKKKVKPADPSTIESIETAHRTGRVDPERPPWRRGTVIVTEADDREWWDGVRQRADEKKRMMQLEQERFGRGEEAPSLQSGPGRRTRNRSTCGTRGVG